MNFEMIWFSTDDSGWSMSQNLLLRHATPSKFGKPKVCWMCKCLDEDAGSESEPWKSLEVQTPLSLMHPLLIELLKAETSFFPFEVLRTLNPKVCSRRFWRFLALNKDQEGFFTSNAHKSSSRLAVWLSRNEQGAGSSPRAKVCRVMEHDNSCPYSKLLSSWTHEVLRYPNYGVNSVLFEGFWSTWWWIHSPPWPEKLKAQLPRGMQAGAIAKSKRIANPGCYPTGCDFGHRNLLKAHNVSYDILFVIRLRFCKFVGHKQAGNMSCISCSSCWDIMRDGETCLNCSFPGTKNLRKHLNVLN